MTVFLLGENLDLSPKRERLPLSKVLKVGLLSAESFFDPGEIPGETTG